MTIHLFLVGEEEAVRCCELPPLHLVTQRDPVIPSVSEESPDRKTALLNSLSSRSKATKQPLNLIMKYTSRARGSKTGKFIIFVRFLNKANSSLSIS
jgi:hypothetical protein